MVYADFESILEPIQGVSNNPNISSTRGVNVHTPSGWCIYSHFTYGKVTNPLTQYRGLNCVNKFCKHIISEAKQLYNSFPERPMAPLTKSQLKEYNNKKRSHTQLDSRKQVIAFQDRVITINIKEAQHPLKREKQVIDKSSIMLKISTKSMHLSY